MQQAFLERVSVWKTQPTTETSERTTSSTTWYKNNSCFWRLTSRIAQQWSSMTSSTREWLNMCERFLHFHHRPHGVRAPHLVFSLFTHCSIEGSDNDKMHPQQGCSDIKDAATRCNNASEQQHQQREKDTTSSSAKSSSQQAIHQTHHQQEQSRQKSFIYNKLIIKSSFTTSSSSARAVFSRLIISKSSFLVDAFNNKRSAVSSTEVHQEQTVRQEFIENTLNKEFISVTANKKLNIEHYDTINFDIVNVFPTVWRTLCDQQFPPG